MFQKSAATLLVSVMTSWTSVSMAGQATYQSLATLFNSPAYSSVPRVADLPLGKKPGRCFSSKAPTDHRDAQLVVFFRKIHDDGDPDDLSDTRFHQPNPEISIAVQSPSDSSMEELVTHGERTTGAENGNQSTSRVVPVTTYTNCLHGEIHFRSSHAPHRSVGGSSGSDITLDLRQSGKYLLVHVVTNGWHQTTIFDHGAVSRVDAPVSNPYESSDLLCYF